MTPIDRKRNNEDTPEAANLRRLVVLSDALVEKYPDNENIAKRNQELHDEYDCIPDSVVEVF